MSGAGRTRVTAWVSGHVQGVGFRWWARDRAAALGLDATATNLDDGRVEVVAEGDETGCRALVGLLREQPSTAGRPGRVTRVVERWSGLRPDGPP